jgi:hypothetical protein
MIALWVRSFWYLDAYSFAVKGGGFGAQSLHGCFLLYWSTEPYAEKFSGYWSSPASICEIRSDVSGSYFWFRLTKLPKELLLLVPMWLSVAAIGGIATTPWLQWRFSLRTLLIATALVAAVLGAAVYAN